MFKIKLAENIKVNNFFNSIIIEGLLGKVKKNKKSYINVFYYKGFLFLNLPIFFDLIGKNKLKKEFSSVIKTFHNTLPNIFLSLNLGSFKSLDLIGVGYRFIDDNKDKLSIKIGFNSLVNFDIAENVKVFYDGKNKISVYGYDWELVSSICSQIKKCRKKDVYKGKGLRYENEVLYLKKSKSLSKL